MRLNYFTVNDATYAYRMDGFGETLLLFHGFTGTSATWQPFILKWKKEFQVIAIDMPGHGATVCQTPRTMEKFCEDIHRLITHLQCDKVHVLGYSMGGRAALSFALLYPQHVHTLILESASPGIKTETERKKRRAHDKELASRMKSNGLHSFVDEWENISLFASQKKLPLKVQQTIRRERLSQTVEGLSESLLYMGTGSQPSWWDHLHQLHIPVLLIVGEQDEKFVQLNKEMKAALENGKVAIVSQAGHAVHVEQMEKFDNIVVEFILHRKGCSHL